MADTPAEGQVNPYEGVIYQNFLHKCKNGMGYHVSQIIPSEIRMHSVIVSIEEIYSRSRQILTHQCIKGPIPKH